MAGADGKDRVRRGLLAAALAASAAFAAAGAFPEIPRESARALGVTRGKPFSKGAVFVNGRYLDPPYQVERWGTGIRINSIRPDGRPEPEQVTGQVVDWIEFVRTQEGAVVSEPPPAEAVAAPPPVAPPAGSDLDALFEDGPRRAPAAPAPAPKPKSEPPACTWSGTFVSNATSQALLTRINAVRTDIDRALRAGGFICFGDRYAQVSGDRRLLAEMLEVLPELQRGAESQQDFRSRIRATSLLFLNETLIDELYRNRIDYRKLRELRRRLNGQ